MLNLGNLEVYQKIPGELWNVALEISKTDLARNQEALLKVTSRPHDRFSRYSKWLDTFRTALEWYMVGQRDEEVILTLTKIPASLPAQTNHIASTEFLCISWLLFLFKLLLPSCTPGRYLNKQDRQLNTVMLSNTSLSLSHVIFEPFYLNKFEVIREVDIKTVVCFAMTKKYKLYIFLLLRATWCFENI
jgi:hypothetical protein